MVWDLEKYGPRTAFVGDDGSAITYGELAHMAEDISGRTGGRCLVFCLCRNTVGSASGYAAMVHARIVPVMLRSGMDPEMLWRLMELYRPAYLWVPEERQPQFAGMDAVYGKYRYCLLRTPYREGYPLYPDLGLLLTTSGSTGSPKFVRQSYGNIRSNAESIVRYLELDETERPVTTLPMNYTYGLSIINSHLKAGAVTLFTECGLMQKDFWDFFKKAEATSFGGVPYTYEMLDRLHFYRMDLPSLRTMTQAGGKLAPVLHRKFAEYASESGRKFVVMYGACEATARMGYLPPERSLGKCGSIGIAIPGGEFSLEDENGREIAEPRQVGELIYKGKNVTLGYAECGEDLCKGDERHGILKTGDMAEFDADGYYYIVGRKKRFLKIYGNRVNLDEVDRMVKEGFVNIDCASTGTDDHMRIFITDPSLTGDVRQFVASKTGLNPSAFKVLAIDGIPRNDSGKTLYKELAAYYEHG